MTEYIQKLGQKDVTLLLEFSSNLRAKWVYCTNIFKTH